MKWFAFTAVVAALVVLYCGGAAVAAEEENAVTVTGKVSVVKIEDVVRAITVTTNDKVAYSLVLDVKGKELGAMDGKMVQVTGTVTQTEDGKKLLKVIAVKPVVEEHKAE